MNKNNNIAIRLTNISKRYTIHHEKPTLAEKIMKTAKWQRDEQFWALKDINLEIKKGERVGIIGPNGSGKTTLLKIISGITTPTIGTAETIGKIVSLIDLDAGFHPDLTGYQNIYLNAMLLGRKKSEIDNSLKSIIDFADIKQFIDTPLFTYSQGMKLRLGFSITVHADPDILILDESLYVGDQIFQEKALKKIKDLFNKGKTILVVTHWLDYVKNNCNKIVVMKNGRISRTGSRHLVDDFYRRMQSKNREFI